LGGVLALIGGYFAGGLDPSRGRLGTVSRAVWTLLRHALNYLVAFMLAMRYCVSSGTIRAQLSPTEREKMHTLTHKYRPTRIADFIGLDKPKRVASKLVSSPFACNLIFSGEPGIGKTSLALAIAEEMPAELHHVTSQECNVERLRSVIGACHYYPTMGKKMHLVLIDEADEMTAAAQLYLLSKLDGSASVPNTIFILTCNSPEKLTEKMSSRLQAVEFFSHGTAPTVAKFLETVWDAEVDAETSRP
jgi:replication-associated recombination protein RarA